MSDIQDVMVEWGDCDEAGIVFYPNYFYWFDCSFQRLLRSRGLSQRLLRDRFNALTPIVHAEAKFVGPARYDDILSLEARIDTWEEKRFRITYNLVNSGRAIASGSEIRAWATLVEKGRLKGAIIDKAFKEIMNDSGE